MRLIDADAYAAELWEMRQNYQMLDDTQTADKIMYGLYRAEQALKDAPTIDAVPVVRCGKCKYFKDGMCYNPNTYDDEKTCGNTTADWFCADGKRKENRNELYLETLENRM